MKQIRLLRMRTGEDVIAEFEIKTEDTVQLTNPTVVVVMPSPPGQQPQVGLSPWQPFSADKSFTVDRENIISESTPNPQFVQQFTQIHSKIITPLNAGIIKS